jgi:hypothetical protein
MALPCHPTALKCHPSKLLQAKPLKGLGRRIPNSGDVSHLGSRRAFCRCIWVKCSTRICRFIIIRPRCPDTARGDSQQERKNDALSSRNNFTICSAPSPKPRCIIPSSIPTPELRS